jgi:hypothetical protein
MKTKGGEPYRIERRTKNKRTAKPLSGYALDITIRVNGEEEYFLDDHNSPRDAMPHNDRDELLETFVDGVLPNHEEHFGHT